MTRFVTRASLLATLLASAACSQTPAPVDLKGHNIYGRNGAVETGRAYSENRNYNYNPSPFYKSYEPAPVYSNTPKPVVSQSTTQSAAVQSIGVSDLAPPPKAASSTPAVKSASVNQWTGKPRVVASESKVQKTAEVKLIRDDKPVDQLDRVIASEDTARPAPSAGLMWPVASKKVISSFGPKGHGKVNDGINIASGEGEPIWAAADGEVVYVGNELQGYGNMVLIKHAGGKTTTYAHMGSATVDKYDRVKQGDIIGYVGATGNVKNPQLHFAVRNGKNVVDPQKYLNSNVAGL
jgi:murein DD-endopeptidase MepM/ murein hydrolase activator NlpD